MRSTLGPCATFLATLALAAGTAALAAGPPRPSPSASVSQVIGVSEVTITYARPSVRGRTIWGELVPYGEVWRTGANEASTLTLAHDATVEGKPLAAGKYALITLPQKDKWTIILNKQADQWGAYGYKQEEDALRVDVVPTTAPHQEAFEISFDEVTPDSATVLLHWAELAVSFKIGFDTPKIAYDVALAETAADGKAGFTWARYFYGENSHTEKALEWATAAAAAQPSYSTLSLEARLAHRAGQGEAAVAAANKAIELAQSGENEGAKRDAEQLRKEMESW